MWKYFFLCHFPNYTSDRVAPNCGQVRPGSPDNSSLHHIFDCLLWEAGGGLILWLLKSTGMMLNPSRSDICIRCRRWSFPHSPSLWSPQLLAGVHMLFLWEVDAILFIFFSKQFRLNAAWMQRPEFLSCQLFILVIFLSYIWIIRRPITLEQLFPPQVLKCKFQILVVLTPDKEIWGFLNLKSEHFTRITGTSKLTAIIHSPFNWHVIFFSPPKD